MSEKNPIPIKSTADLSISPKLREMWEGGGKQPCHCCKCKSRCCKNSSTDK